MSDFQKTPLSDLHCCLHYCTTVPNKAPIPVVMAIASSPQKPTRKAPFQMFDPPVRDAVPPMRARKTSEPPATTGMANLSGLINTSNNGMAAPTAKVAAEARLAWMGRAVWISVRPNSSLACDPKVVGWIEHSEIQQTAVHVGFRGRHLNPTYNGASLMLVGFYLSDVVL